MNTSYGKAPCEPTDEEVKMMRNDKLKKFVRSAGSEEAAIGRLMSMELADTIPSKFIWYRQLDTDWSESQVWNYASRKIQAYYWILKIYNKDYTYANRGFFDCCQFFDSNQEPITDCHDLDIQVRAHFYSAVIWSPVDHDEYFKRLMKYFKCQNPGYEELRVAFDEWYAEMKIHGLQYMRDNSRPPVAESKYLKRAVLKNSFNIYQYD